jgi:IS30 family transposase
MNMAKIETRGLSAAQKSELWQRWKKGHSLSEIGRALGKHAGSISGFLSKTGGIAPAVRQRSSCSLTLSEREDISRGISAGQSFRSIADQIRRSVSTVSREVKRNGGREAYRATSADQRAWNLATRPKQCRLATNTKLQAIVAEKLQLDWAPQQIAGWLKHQFPQNTDMQISHETIYRSLYIQARGVLKKELLKHLRTHRVMRRSKHASSEEISRTSITQLVSIKDRPVDVETRLIAGHWEGDLISGSKNSHIATLVERHSRFTMLIQIDGKDTKSVVSALIRQVSILPKTLRKTLTWDRGGELADHQSFCASTEMSVYFCDPQSPWQRGSNENTNRLLRQYFPKGTDLSGYSQQYLDKIAQKLNQRPRKVLGYISAAEQLANALH